MTVKVYANPNLDPKITGIGDIYSTKSGGNYYKKYKISTSYAGTGSYTYYIKCDNKETKIKTTTDNFYTCDLTQYTAFTGKSIQFGIKFTKTLDSGSTISAEAYNSSSISVPSFFDSSKTVVYNNSNKTNITLNNTTNYFYNDLYFYLKNTSNFAYYDSGATLLVQY
jgi:hypothetical protein